MTLKRLGNLALVGAVLAVGAVASFVGVTRGPVALADRTSALHASSSRTASLPQVVFHATQTRSLDSSDVSGLQSQGIAVQSSIGSAPIDVTSAVNAAAAQFPGFAGGTVDRVELALASTPRFPALTGKLVWVLAVTPRPGSLHTDNGTLDPAYYYAFVDASTGDPILATAAGKPTGTSGASAAASRAPSSRAK